MCVLFFQQELNSSEKSNNIGMEKYINDFQYFNGE